MTRTSRNWIVYLRRSESRKRRHSWPRPVPGCGAWKSWRENERLWTTRSPGRVGRTPRTYHLEAAPSWFPHRLGRTAHKNSYWVGAQQKLQRRRRYSSLVDALEKMLRQTRACTNLCFRLYFLFVLSKVLASYKVSCVPRLILSFCVLFI